MRTFSLPLTLLTAIIILSPVASAQWTSIGPAEVIHHMRSVSFLDEMRGYVAGWISISSGTGGVQGIVARTTDGGETWSTETINKVEINAIHFADADKGFAVGGGYDCGCAVLLRTTDAGRNWTTQEYTGLAGAFQAIDFAGAQDGIIGGGNPETGAGYIMRTTDGGNSWIRVFEQEGAHVSRLELANPTTAYAAAGAEAGGENTIYKTTNLNAGVGTIAWTATKTFDGFVSIGGLDFVSEGTGYVVMTTFDGGDFRGEIHRTTDGGTAWEEVFGTLEFTLVAIDFDNAENGLAVGENGAIVQTDDGGATWGEQITHETALLTSVQFVTPGIAYAAGTDGTIMKYDRASSAPEEAESTNGIHVDILPNPSLGRSTIHVEGGMEGGNYRLLLSDATGREVRSVDVRDGRGELKSEGLPAGSYFYRLVNDGNVVMTGSLIVH